MEEFWDVYDINGNPLGIKIERGHKLKENQFHKVIHIWIYNEKGEFLIQKRAKHLKWNPNIWATTTGSIVSGALDEKTEAYRELYEELNLDNTDVDLNFYKKIIIGHSIVYIFEAFMPKYISKKIVLNEEVLEYKWMTLSKIIELRKDNLFATYSDELIETISKLKNF